MRVRVVRVTTQNTASHSVNSITSGLSACLPVCLLKIVCWCSVLQLTSFCKISPGLVSPTVCVYLSCVTLNLQNKCTDSQLCLFVLHSAGQCRPVQGRAVFLLTLQCTAECRPSFIIIDLLGSWLLSPYKTQNNPLRWGLSIKWTTARQNTLRVYGVFFLFKWLDIFIERA